jgi:hypothetical protein
VVRLKANPTTMSYNASVLKIFGTSSLNKFFFYLEKTLYVAYYNAGVVVNSKVVGWAPGHADGIGIEADAFKWKWSRWN